MQTYAQGRSNMVVYGCIWYSHTTKGSSPESTTTVTDAPVTLGASRLPAGIVHPAAGAPPGARIRKKGT